MLIFGFNNARGHVSNISFNNVGMNISKQSKYALSIIYLYQIKVESCSKIGVDELIPEKTKWLTKTQNWLFNDCWWMNECY